MPPCGGNFRLEDAKTYSRPLLQGSQQNDEYWNWQSKSRRAAMLPGGELYAIECEGMTQGLMTIDILKKRCQIQSQFRKRLVYIEALATAPWNRAAISDPPLYKGVGSAFVSFAIARSYELGYKGRVGLHSLEGALGFYRRLRVGFLECGPDPIWVLTTQSRLYVAQAATLDGAICASLFSRELSQK